MTGAGNKKTSPAARKLFAVCLIAFSMPSLSAKAQAVADTSDRRISEDQFQSLISALQRGLNDPFSAQLMQLDPGNFGRVCGKVNAKNSFGGYTGFKLFTHDPKTGQFYFLPELEGFNIAAPDADTKLAEAKLAVDFIGESCQPLKRASPAALPSGQVP